MKYRLAIVKYRQIDEKSNNIANYELMAVDLEIDAVITRLDKDAVHSGLYLPGDNIKIYNKNGLTLIENLSCQALKGTRFSRNLNSLMRNMSNEHHPLNRVLIKNNLDKSCFWLLPYEQHLRHPYLRETTQEEKIDSR